MAPMSQNDYERYTSKELIHLIRNNGNTVGASKQERNKHNLIQKALGLGLDRAVVDTFWAQSDQTNPRDKPARRSKARKNAHTGNDDTPEDDRAEHEDSGNEEEKEEEIGDEPFHESEAEASGYRAEPNDDNATQIPPWQNNQTFANHIPQALKAEILARSHECLQAQNDEDIGRMNSLIVERNGLYEQARTINPTEFQNFRMGEGGPDGIFPTGNWEAFDGDE
jgi:hypothetical protein